MPYSRSVTITGMEDFDNPTVRLVAKIFLIVGLILLIVAVVIYASSSVSQKNRIETDAEITDFDRDGYPYILYQVDDQVYETHLNYKSSAMRSGDEIRIRYDPENPRSAESVTGSWLGIGITGGLGVLFAGLGTAFLCLARKARNRKSSAVGTPDSPYPDSPYHNSSES